MLSCDDVYKDIINAAHVLNINIHGLAFLMSLTKNNF